MKIKLESINHEVSLEEARMLYEELDTLFKAPIRLGKQLSESHKLPPWLEQQPPWWHTAPVITC